MCVYSFSLSKMCNTCELFYFIHFITGSHVSQAALELSMHYVAEGDFELQSRQKEQPTVGPRNYSHRVQHGKPVSILGSLTGLWLKSSHSTRVPRDDARKGDASLSPLCTRRQQSPTAPLTCVSGNVSLSLVSILSWKHPIPNLSSLLCVEVRGQCQASSLMTFCLFWLLSVNLELTDWASKPRAAF